MRIRDTDLSLCWDGFDSSLVLAQTHALETQTAPDGCQVSEPAIGSQLEKFETCDCPWNMIRSEVHGEGWREEKVRDDVHVGKPKGQGLLYHEMRVRGVAVPCCAYTKSGIGIGQPPDASCFVSTKDAEGDTGQRESLTWLWLLGWGI